MIDANRNYDGNAHGQAAGELSLTIGDAMISLKIFRGNFESHNTGTGNPGDCVPVSPALNLGGFGNGGGSFIAADGADGHEKCKPTLREIYERYMAADLRPGTAQQYRAMLSHWEAKIGALPVAAIRDEHLEQFRDVLAERLAANTVRKTFRHLRAVLNRCGPRSDRNPRGLGLIEERPYALPPEGERKYVRDCTLEEAGALFAAARYLRYRPHTVQLDAADWWRAQLIFVWFHGIRTANLFLLGCDAIRDDAAVDADPILRDAGFRRPFSSSAGWLVYVPAKTARRKPFPLVLPCHPLARAAFERLQGQRAGGDFLFGVPKFQNIKSNYYKAEKQWGGQAGIDWGISVGAIRKACSTRFNDQCAGLGAYVLGHAPGRAGDQVNAVHYDAVLERLRKATAALEYPREFDAWG